MIFTDCLAAQNAVAVLPPLVIKPLACSSPENPPVPDGWGPFLWGACGLSRYINIYNKEPMLMVVYTVKYDIR